MLNPILLKRYRPIYQINAQSRHIRVVRDVILTRTTPPTCGKHF